MFLGCSPCCGITCETDWSAAQSVVVEMTTGGNVVRTLELVTTNLPFNGFVTTTESVFVYVGAFNGTHVLSKIQSNVTVFNGQLGSIWQLQFATPNGCSGPPMITLHLANRVLGQQSPFTRKYYQLYIQYPRASRVERSSEFGTYASCPAAATYTDESIGCETSFNGVCGSYFHTLVASTNAFPFGYGQCVAGSPDSYSDVFPGPIPVSLLAPFSVSAPGSGFVSETQTTHSGDAPMVLNSVSIVL